LQQFSLIRNNSCIIQMSCKHTLINVGPALSIELMRNEYHHNVPVRSFDFSGILSPMKQAGIEANIGTKIMTKCTNLSVVAMGSYTQSTYKKYIRLSTRTGSVELGSIFRLSSSSCFEISS